ncbi:MAG: polymerase subunit gamma and tau [Acidobacteria bacterium]|jgi:DNA polymerase III subunit gamma/tau|nr:polymerase subunit gamma and tau [Acidobacteriota bacterium]
MSYQVIARKWRPQTFEEVTGQEAITRTLRNAIEHDRLHHAYLFSGARGVGKTTTARLLAKALNCHKTTKPNPQPCSFTDENACASCREISESRSIDVLEFDAASHTKVEEIRDIILESININPARDRYKIFIIDEVHMLSTSSFNALLKTLEEPPPNVEFIMATTELHKVPDTILSRCQEFEFRTIAVNKIFERLKLIAEAENINIADEALREIARSGEGSMRDAQSNFDQVISFSGERIETSDVTTALGLASAEMLTRITRAIAERNPKEALLVVDELISRGQDLRNFCRDLLSFFRDLLVFKMAADSENLLDTAILSREEMRVNAEPFSESDFIRFFNSLSETETKLKEAKQSRYVLEIGLVKLIEMRRVVAVEKILERLTRLEAALSNGNIPASSAPVEEKPFNSFGQSAEKKTLNDDFSAPKYNFSPEEVPFPTGERQNAKFAAQNVQSVSKAVAAAVAETAPVKQFKELAGLPEEKPFVAEENPFVDNFSREIELPQGAEILQTEVKKNNLISAEFLDNVAMKLPLISSEELEHVEDNWLDAAYESKLQREGDNLFPIKNAAKIFEILFPASKSQSFSINGEQANGDSSANAPAKAKSTFVMPVFETEEESTEIPALSENPTEEELLVYAHNHPLVRKALRIFRGKIIEVKKIDDRQKFFGTKKF